ncbi:MAG: 4Fe-4S binding protein [Promethearchaeati archaeon SRVP18_Atabeyarchaeia-1]|jgi:hydrogenase-4 component H
MPRQVPGRIFREAIRKKSRATIMYPFEKPEVFEGARGLIEHFIEKCSGCGLCARDCPAKVITMVEDTRTKTKKKPEFHYDKCTFCSQCEESCPTKAIKLTTQYELAGTDRSKMVIST